MVDLCNIKVFGELWGVKMCELKEDSWFEENNADGRCLPFSRTITVVNAETDTRVVPVRDKQENKRAMEDTLRHEIIHAFLFEAGLNGNAIVFESGWADNEEMIEFFAWNWERINQAIVVACGNLYDRMDGVKYPVPRVPEALCGCDSASDKEKGGIDKDDLCC